MRFGLSAWFAFGLLAALGCTRQQALPHYGPLPVFSLQDQHGNTLTQRDLQGRVAVVDFIFTSCPDVCPLLTEQLHSLRKQFPSDAPLRLVSFSVDPGHDTPERLRQFAMQHGADQFDWLFLTGPLEQVKHVVMSGFKQAMQAEPIVEDKPRNVLHGTHYVLVDATGEIRGFYASDDEGRTALRAAVESLIAKKGTS